MSLSRLVLTIASAMALTVGVTACGGEEEVLKAHSEGIYVTTGGLQYQVQISRQLNPDNAEDSDYLVGLPEGETLGDGEQYFAVFLRAFNRGDKPIKAAGAFRLTDTTSRSWNPVALDTTVNRVAFRALEVDGGQQLPPSGSLARDNTTQGGMVLFKIPVAAYDSRPLTFHIQPSDGEPASVDLDV